MKLTSWRAALRTTIMSLLLLGAHEVYATCIAVKVPPANVGNVGYAAVKAGSSYRVGSDLYKKVGHDVVLQAEFACDPALASFSNVRLDGLVATGAGAFVWTGGNGLGRLRLRMKNLLVDGVATEFVDPDSGKSVTELEVTQAGRPIQVALLGAAPVKRVSLQVVATGFWPERNPTLGQQQMSQRFSVSIN